MKAGKEDCVLLVVDVQERLIGTIENSGAMVAGVRALIDSAGTFNIPVIVTEQEKLGETIPHLMERMGVHIKVKKLEFSCCRNAVFMEALEKTGRKTAVICGIEAHICILQTALDLLEGGYKVQVVRDAISSHATVDHETAIERMRDAGATITTTEALLYELAAKAGTPEFKRILDITKEKRRGLKSE